MSHGRPFRENANESAVEPVANRILLRPWMRRLGVALIVFASPASAVAGWIVAYNAYPGLAAPPAWVLVPLIGHSANVLLAGIIIGAVYSAPASGEPMTPTFVMRVAWAWITYPTILLRLVAKWIATGSTEDS